MKKSESSVEQQPLSSKAQQLTKGLGKFVSQIINMYKSGFNSRRMLLQQSLAKVAAPPPPLPLPLPRPFPQQCLLAWIKEMTISSTDLFLP